MPWASVNEFQWLVQLLHDHMPDDASVWRDPGDWLVQLFPLLQSTCTQIFSTVADSCQSAMLVLLLLLRTRGTWLCQPRFQSTPAHGAATKECCCLDHSAPGNNCTWQYSSVTSTAATAVTPARLYQIRIRKKEKKKCSVLRQYSLSVWF
eukprot:scpid32092/ scgid21545/ 